MQEVSYVMSLGSTDAVGEDEDGDGDHVDDDRDE